MSLQSPPSGSPHKSKMEAGDGEEVNPFSFKSFVQSKAAEPPSYASSIDKKNKQRPNDKSKSKKKEIFDSESPFPEVDNHDLNVPDLEESASIYVPSAANPSNGKLFISYHNITVNTSSLATTNYFYNFTFRDWIMKLSRFSLSL